MSAKLSLLVLVALVAAAALEATPSEKIKSDGPDDIINYVEIDEDLFHEVTNALLDLGIPADKQITREVLEQSFESAGNKYAHLKRYLLDIDEHEEFCSLEIATSLVAIFKQKSLHRFRSFFESYWWEKFQACEAKEVRGIMKDFPKATAYKALNEFLMAQLTSQPADDEEYYKILKGVELNGHNYKSDAGMAVVEDHPESWAEVDEQGKEVKVDPNTKYVRFVTEKCWYNFHPAHRQFAVINVAKRFEQAKSVEMQSNGLQFNIINEWNRICLGWLQGGTLARKGIMDKTIKHMLGQWTDQ